MSSRPSSSRGRRPDNDSYNDEYRNEGSRPRHSLKSDDSQLFRGKPRQSRDEKSPADIRKNRYDSSSKGRGRDSDDNGGGVRRMERSGRGARSDKRFGEPNDSYGREDGSVRDMGHGDCRHERKVIGKPVFNAICLCYLF